MTFATLALILLPVPAMIPPQQDDRIVRLRDGRLVVGVIEEHDLDGFSMVTALDGGRFVLSWSDLFPGEAERLREAFGYRVETTMPTTHAHRVLLTNGQERIGRILNEDNERIELRTLETSVVIPKVRLAAPPEPVVVEVPMVLTGEQFYTERSPEIASDDRMAQYAFAQELQAVFALERAAEHYAIAETLASEAGDDALLRRVQGSQQQLERLTANREEAEALEAIRRAMHRERFTEAEQLLDAWDDTFPQSALRAEMLAVADDFEADRDAAMTRYLRRSWYGRVLGLLKKQALDRDAVVEEMMAWLETEVPQLVRAQMIEELQMMDDTLSLQDIDRLWLARLDGGAARHQAGYGDGSWILGEERARAGLQTTEAEADDGKSPEQREMEERMQRYLRNLEAQRRAGGASEEDETPEDWWRTARVTQRFQWLLAYYAEFSGDFELTSVSFATCSTCGGTGVIESTEMGQDGARNRRVKCPTCHQVAVRRSVNFR